ncbi:hypothetical protein PNH50_04715 [Leisingera aquaemixtae]|uniref:hypothetical protein n=1 Tax=Leisingera aquaemixtae TaxID=1396826 RepID=UPI00398421B2
MRKKLKIERGSSVLIHSVETSGAAVRRSMSKRLIRRSRVNVALCLYICGLSEDEVEEVVRPKETAPPERKRETTWPHSPNPPERERVKPVTDNLNRQAKARILRIAKKYNADARHVSFLLFRSYKERGKVKANLKKQLL